MNYKETLEAVRQVGESAVYDAMIANEVDFFFEATGGKDRDDFEWLCELASTAYLKVDTTTSLSQVVESLRDLVESGAKDITHHDILNNIY